MLLVTHLVDQVLARIVVGHAELLPPVGQQFVHLADVGAQAHEVERSAKARLIHHTERRTADAFFKARLHDPDFAHVAGQLAAARHIANAGIEHVVNRIQQRGVAGLATGLAALPAITHIRPQHAGQQEAGRNRLAFAHAAVGVFQCRVHKGLLGTLHHHIQQRVDTAVHAQLLQVSR